MNDFSITSLHQKLVQQPYTSRKAPLIGITGNFGEKGCELAKDYYTSISLAGAVPIIIPPFENLNFLLPLLNHIDALIFSGGSDINPLYTGEDPIPELHCINNERDLSELLLARLAHERGIPMLGICRGMQVMATALGGKVCQDLKASLPNTSLLKHSGEAERHVPTHWVHAKEDSTIEKRIGKHFAVNSFHHQAVIETGSNFHVTAQSADGVIEAMESSVCRPEIAVQWHPESFWPKGDERMRPLFEWLIEEATCYAQAKNFHTQHITLDSHTDTPMFFSQDIHFAERDPRILVDMHKLSDGMIDAVAMVAYIPQRELTLEGHRNATIKAENLLNGIRQMVQTTEGVEIAYNHQDILNNKQKGIRSILLGIENAYAFGESIDTLRHFASQGIIYATLCHNGDNAICDSASRTQHTHHGLSKWGHTVVHEMNRLGIMIDLSHAGEDTFYDVLAESNLPVICSHSSCRSLCDHPRNLTDEQLRALAKKNGVAQITFYHGFLRQDGDADIHDVVAHILHAIKIAGINHVGIGSDFDGDGGVCGLTSEADMTLLTRLLIRAGLTSKELRLLWGENFLRVLTQNQTKKIHNH